MSGPWMRYTAAVWMLLVCGTDARAGEDPLRHAARSKQNYLLVEFTSATCPACDQMQPVVAQVLAGHPELRFQKVDADLEVELSRRYKVKCVPVYVVLDQEGEVRFNDVGMRTAEELEQILKQAGVNGR
ncbi:MAG TPA: thioredoxin family protein [Deferrisomatales bacterium]|nr:thioredoxin family protein [Deferrisomatales bacterium]